MFSYVKEFVRTHEADIVLVIGVFLVSLISFGLGRLSLAKSEHTPIKIEEVGSVCKPMEMSTTTTHTNSLQQDDAQLVASRNGSKYYFPWCAGVSRIKEANKVTFASEVEAQAAGYELAANCN